LLVILSETLTGWGFGASVLDIGSERWPSSRADRGAFRTGEGREHPVRAMCPRRRQPSCSRQIRKVTELSGRQSRASGRGCLSLDPATSLLVSSFHSSSTTRRTPTHKARKPCRQLTIG